MMDLILEPERDPYKNFVYTSFQELATYISHNRVAQMAKNMEITSCQKCAN
jgi:acyl-[acyl-carrier-protein] desaturase